MPSSSSASLTKALGQRIRQLREGAGLTPAAVAREGSLGSASALERIESGRAEAPLATLLAIADALRVPLLQLFTFPTQDFFQELVDRLRHVRMVDLESILGRARGGAGQGAGASAKAGGRGQAPVTSYDDLAEWVLKLPTKGSRLEAVQRSVLLHALDVSGGNVSAASRLLGINRKAFERRLARMRIADRRRA